ncbi:tetratricopeptide repeat protein, partial [Frankia sp. CNm7]
MEPGLTGRQVAALAGLFADQLAARQLLAEAGIPTEGLPWGSFVPRTFWTALSDELAAGVSAGGRDRLLNVLRARYPENDVFADPAPGQVVGGAHHLPGVWSVPPRLAHFTGRANLLDELDLVLAEQRTAAVCALQGLGGVGKTALAVEYAHLRASQFEVVWWLPAQDQDLLSGHVAALGAALGLGDDADWPAVAASLRANRRRWLLVLDNVDDPDIVGLFRPADPYGRLLVTSRLAGLDGAGEAITVREFTADEATRLLTCRLPGIGPATAGKIAALLGFLPLALEQSASYLTQTSLPPSEYVTLLETRLSDMLSRGRVADRPRDTVANLWRLSTARLEADEPAAVSLLEICAVCAPDPVPLDLVTDGIDELRDGPLRRAAEDPVAWADAVGALVGYGLARRDGRSLVVHRLTAAATRAALDVARHHDAVATVTRMLSLALPRNIYDPAGWPRWRTLLPHVFAILDRDDATWDDDAVPIVSLLCDLVGRYLEHHGRPDLAIPYLCRGLDLDTAHRGVDHPDTLTARHNLAGAYGTAGRVDQAIRLFEQVLADRVRMLGGNHPDTLTARHNLAYTYRVAGRVHEAINLFEDVLTDQVRVLGNDHPDTLTTRNILAGTYRVAGRGSEAINLFEDVLTDQVRVLGNDHPDTLTTRHNLAYTYRVAGRVHEAINLFEDVL